MAQSDNPDEIDEKRVYRAQANYTENHFVVFHEDDTDDIKEEKEIEDDENKATKMLNIKWDNGVEHKEYTSAPSYYVAMVYVNILPTRLENNRNFSISVRVVSLADSFWEILLAWWFLILGCGFFGCFTLYNWMKMRGQPTRHGWGWYDHRRSN